jgi:O-antigen/teichoic acid export membrane protein
MMKFRSGLKQGSFAYSVAMIAGGTALGQLLIVLVSPLLTRLYTPEDFGLLAAFISIFTILVTINSLRYELAIPMADTPETAANLTALVVLLVAVTTILFGVVFWLGGEPLARLVNAPELTPYFGLMLLSLFGAGIYQAFTYWAIRQEAFNPIARTRFAQSLGTAITQLGLGILGVGAGGLMFGHAIGQIVGTTSLFQIAWRNNRDTFKKITVSSITEVAQRYRRFPLFVGWSGLLNTASVQLPALFLISLYGAEVAGWFALGQRVVGLPMSLVGTAVAQVYVSKASQISRENPAGLPSFFFKTSRRLLILGILPIGILAVIAPWLFQWVFGEAWGIAGVYLQIMVPMFLLQFVVSSLSQTIIVVERQDLLLIFDVTRLTMVAFIFVVAALAKVPAEITIAFYSGGMFMTYGLYFLMSQHALKHYIQDKQGNNKHV